MYKMFISLVASAITLVSCGGGSNEAPVGSPCQEDSDCSELCLTLLEGEWMGEWQTLDFPGGMCTEHCDTPGEWSKYDICLVYSPTDEQFFFPTCRNDLDCRANEGYICLVVGYDENLQPAKACLPPGAQQ